MRKWLQFFFGAMAGGAVAHWIPLITGKDPASLIQDESWAEMMRWCIGPAGGGLLGGIVGLLVGNKYGRDTDEETTPGGRAVVGGIGGAFQGALIGGSICALAGALMMAALSMVQGEDMDWAMGGVIGASIIGLLAGAGGGIAVGVAPGLVVGTLFAMIGAAPEPAKPDFVIADEGGSGTRPHRIPADKPKAKN